MKLFLFLLLVISIFLTLEASPVFCVYCTGGTPCYWNGDCSEGCRCQAPPYTQGVCIPHYNSN